MSEHDLEVNGLMNIDSERDHQIDHLTSTDTTTTSEHDSEVNGLMTINRDRDHQIYH